MRKGGLACLLGLRALKPSFWDFLFRYIETILCYWISYLRDRQEGRELGEEEVACKDSFGCTFSTHVQSLPCTSLYKPKILIAWIYSYCFTEFNKVHLIQRSCRTSWMALIRCGFLDCSNSFNCFSARKGLAECVCSVRLPALTAPVGFAPTKVVTSDSVCHKLQPVLTGNLSFPYCYIKVQEKRQPLVEKYR